MHWTLKFTHLFMMIAMGGFASHGVVDLGELQRQGQGAPIYPVAIESNVPEGLQLANAAFRLHGAYRLVGKEESVFCFRLQKTGASRVELSIESGRPLQVQFRQELMGETFEVALLKACDQAVKKTLGIPGFFSGKLAFVQHKGTLKPSPKRRIQRLNEASGHRATEICTSNLFFQRVTQLTQDQKHSVTPHWSKDGNKIVYTGYLNGFPDLFVMNLKTKKRHAFASYAGTNTGGAFSPDGKQVAMILSSSGNPEVYVAHANGQHPMRLTRSKAVEASPTWSPSGRKLAYTSDRMGGPQIFEMDLSKGRAERRLTFKVSGYCAEPHWNPIFEDQLACTAAVSKTFQIAILDLKTGSSRFLTKPPGSAVEPCWLNDGRHLVFTRRQNGDERLCLLDTVTGKETPLHGSELGSLSQPSFFYPEF